MAGHSPNAAPSALPNAAVSPNAPGPRVWSMRWRIVASLALAWHLVALLIGPISVPPSILGEEARAFGGGIGQAYLEATFLDHAYKFFAPDPGPSHLVRYELVLEDGSLVSGTFPNLNEQWPRLLYHRHFMLSESLAAFAMSPDIDPNTPWEKLPLSERQLAYANSFADRLLAGRGAVDVSLFLVQHRFPSPDEFEAGMKLDDRRLYRERLVYTRRTKHPKPAAQTGALSRVARPAPAG